MCLSSQAVSIVRCQATEVYNNCPTCEGTCERPVPVCPQINCGLPRCTCRRGLVRHGLVCITPAQCPQVLSGTAGTLGSGIPGIGGVSGVNGVPGIGGIPVGVGTGGVPGALGTVPLGYGHRQ
ncbi:unnamed protein product [Enterobius vermicularis]|uniref:TIL domain-containing protein n=1 Tax=Enterobius vermicularis TaxID=51028 RepID=A0A0N4UUV2_ENTVE|nr:unnamed protein product [Enterobius vermicularis]